MDLPTSAPQVLSIEEVARRLRVLEERWVRHGFGDPPELGAVEHEADNNEADIVGGGDPELETDPGEAPGEPLESMEVDGDNDIDIIVVDSSDASNDEVPRRERVVSCSACHVIPGRSCLLPTQVPF